ncbi:carbamoyltransferase HypF [Heliobacterium chlorum]|uniref:Carbamoyltransferase n=1 Tax=Heliobacterium chlorum TaxID=2698 RepID=A0ABR7T3V2_HELCL|nr:carbamoyltransferase HypF [Heliobacterium chlorum]
MGGSLLKVAKFIRVTGTVQGVGFRPFVFKLAKQAGLSGWVLNGPAGVEITVEGEPEQVDKLLQALPEQAPQLSRVREIILCDIPVQGLQGFTIVQSEDKALRTARIPPDAALCAACREEMADPLDRHYRYPFTNCTHCGPRFTIVRQVPYDRPLTSMHAFPMCPDCAREYEDPLDRRFHAQPVACPNCGPQVWICGQDGKRMEGPWDEIFRRLIRQGRIIALKGLGGFHLVCDGRNAAAVAELRRRKNRPYKALALMARDMDTVRLIAWASAQEERLLTSSAAPIVILEQRNGCKDFLLDGTDKGVIPSNIAPGTKTVGLMLPYTPMHHMLFDEQIDLLVMTSGNPNGLPLVRENEAALDQLVSIADAFVLHDRNIISRCDDSVVRVIDGEVQFYRRSRGYVPGGIAIPWPERKLKHTLLAAGPETKNTFALLGRGEAYFSQYIGNVDTREGRQNYLESLQNLQTLLDIRPKQVLRDLHPQYRISALAAELAQEMDLAMKDVQHHHAHLAAVLADNGVTGRAIGVILDGTGFGEDGTIWGFEILTGDLRTYERWFHLRPVLLPGGEAAVRRPWLTACAFLGEALGSRGWEQGKTLFPEQQPVIEQARMMVEKKLNSPQVSSAGRFFDALSAIIGVCLENTYDGQAPLELGEQVRFRLGVTDHSQQSKAGLDENKLCTEDWVDKALAFGHYPFAIQKDLIDFASVFEELLQDKAQGVTIETLASRVHNTVARMVEVSVQRTRDQTGLQRVALGGGVFQNPYLLTMVRHLLSRQGFQVFIPRRVPANDGGLALGQGVIGLWREE